MLMQQVSGCESCGVVMFRGVDRKFTPGILLVRRFPSTGRRNLMYQASATQGTGSI
jgi:hypothetical protein